MDVCILSEYLQVKPSSALDPCLSPVAEVATKLRSYVLGDGNNLDEFLNKGELSQAVQLSLSVLKSVNEENDCGQTHSSDLQRLVCKTQKQRNKITSSARCITYYRCYSRLHHTSISKEFPRKLTYKNMR